MTTSTMTLTDCPRHVSIDPAILYWGTPVVLVSTCNEDGSANLAPISSVFWLGTTAVLGFGRASHTLANLRRTGELVLNLPSTQQVDTVDRLALTTGAPSVNPWKRAAGYTFEPRKFDRAGLTPVASTSVAPPRADQCPVAMEARVIDVRLTDVALVTAEVERVHVHPELRLAGHPNRVDPNRWRPLIMSFQRFYGLGDELQPSRLASVDEEHYR